MNHDAADTWMDARINNKEPWSDRGSKAVEIQALWFSMLESGAYLADKNGETELNKKWDKLAQKLKTNFYNKFWDKEIRF
ncbi:MAG: hypothetical protein B6229_09945 [Spirochaetaceae bacterium 4572_7]|nr:MAG: hypothetical protein B6229_09945 [Spirochaetaceae bacterium 4572_7]